MNATLNPTTTWNPANGGSAAVAVQAARIQISPFQEKSESRVQLNESSSRNYDTAQVSRTAADANGALQPSASKASAPLYDAKGAGRIVDNRPPLVTAILFNSIDRDCNGVITRSELRGLAANFTAMDRDHDGIITRRDVTSESGNTAPAEPTPKQHISVAA